MEKDTRMVKSSSFVLVVGKYQFLTIYLPTNKDM